MRRGSWSVILKNWPARSSSTRILRASALGNQAEEAYRRALATRSNFSFWGIVAFNRTVDEAAARAVIEIFTEVVIAPDYDEAAWRCFRTKKNLRVLKAEPYRNAAGLEYKQI